jgi:hypothetical protein
VIFVSLVYDNSFYKKSIGIVHKPYWNSSQTIQLKMMHLSTIATLIVILPLALGQNLRPIKRNLVGGTRNSVCMQESYGLKLTCTVREASLVKAHNITILDDGCKFPGDIVKFSANFELVATVAPRYDIGIWFSRDGDPNNDGSRIGACTAATPYVNLDTDYCGDIPTNIMTQYPLFTLQVTCRGNGAGKLLLPYCMSYRRGDENSLCTTASEAEPVDSSRCMCDNLFNVNIPVPTSTGSGSGIGDPHFERYETILF